MAERLSQRFYRRPTEEVARALLGKVLVHGRHRARITECEAYLGAHDLASHARFGVTPRSRLMFQGGGLAYVYLCYGIHHLFNIVTDAPGSAGAVLIRGARLLEDDVLVDGPGKLTRALGVDLRHNGLDLTRARDLYLSSGRGARRIAGESITVSPRIGVAYAGEWSQALLRFVAPG